MTERDGTRGPQISFDTLSKIFLGRESKNRRNFSLQCDPKFQRLILAYYEG